MLITYLSIILIEFCCLASQQQTTTTKNPKADFFRHFQSEGCKEEGMDCRHNGDCCRPMKCKNLECEYTEEDDASSDSTNQLVNSLVKPASGQLSGQLSGLTNQAGLSKNRFGPKDEENSYYWYYNNCSLRGERCLKPKDCCKELVCRSEGSLKKCQHPQSRTKCLLVDDLCEGQRNRASVCCKGLLCSDGKCKPFKSLKNVKDVDQSEKENEVGAEDKSLEQAEPTEPTEPTEQSEQNEQTEQTEQSEDRPLMAANYAP